MWNSLNTRSLRKTVSGCAAVLGLAGVLSFGVAEETLAATIGVAPPSLDFGSVALGTTSDPLNFSVTVSLAPGEVIVGPELPTGFNQFGFNIQQNSGDCISAEGGTCDFSVFFTPDEIGLSQTTVQIFIGIRLSEILEGDVPPGEGEGDLNLFGYVDLSGVGIEATVTPVPLPAALPMFAGGIGLLGLLGWRRKRKVSEAAG